MTDRRLANEAQNQTKKENVFVARGFRVKSVGIQNTTSHSIPNSNSNIPI